MSSKTVDQSSFDSTIGLSFSSRNTLTLPEENWLESEPWSYNSCAGIYLIVKLLPDQNDMVKNRGINDAVEIARL